MSGTLLIVVRRQESVFRMLQHSYTSIQEYFILPQRAFSQAAGVFYFLAKIAKDAKIYNN